jgi:hypothetical protein
MTWRRWRRVWERILMRQKLEVFTVSPQVVTTDSRVNKGLRHEEPARLAARGAYAIVNNDPRVPSERTTHLGYHLSHPVELGDVQESLGISEASSFVLQVKNPLAPPTGEQRVGLSPGKTADYPPDIMDEVFGKGTKGRESYGLRFASCERTELLDYEGAELLLIAAKGGEDGLERTLGEGRGEGKYSPLISFYGC